MLFYLQDRDLDWIGTGDHTCSGNARHTTNMMCVMKKCTGYGRNELGEENCDFDTEPDWCIYSVYHYRCEH